MAVPQWANMTYGDNDKTPVPMKSYRCPATARDTSKKAHTHPCKKGVDHDGDHACVCGRSWKRADDLAKGIA